MNPQIPDNRTLAKIWAQVPVNYYNSLNFGQRMWHQHKWRLFQNIFHAQKFKTKRVLEIGCANGHLTGLLAQEFPHAKITGIDVYKAAVSEAQKKYSGITFRVADAHKLPFKKNTFDLIVCSETIEHVVNPSRVLHEISRVLTKNGRAIIEMDSGSILFQIVWSIWTNWGKGRVWKGAHLHPFKAAQLEAQIRGNGFTVHKKMISHLGMAVTFVVSKKR